jgi:AcrR family transcriptional regulator
MPAAPATSRAPRLSRQERETLVLDTAARLFWAREVHEVGMDELVRATGLGKATVYRLYPTKDALVAAYLRRLAAAIGAAIENEITAHEGDPGLLVWRCGCCTGAGAVGGGQRSGIDLVVAPAAGLVNT